ncbi:hypothetical protein [Flavobacterium saliperosum]|uniref:Uncharacterized protein n=1 Tax=Flavobacterium saliperosum TaxID=329186 RepID=A0A1G4V6G4_9FLAO|nr:hypothetical protein [Flavobacterium saliperosum]SCX01027.1 hypothetical protein SAMN02927925_00254 [Flavobacterium saliperosum]
MKIFFYCFLLINAVSSAQSLTIMNSSNVRVRYGVGAAEMNCTHSVTRDGLLINANTVEFDRVTFSDFGPQNWYVNSNPVSPAFCETKYGLPNFSIVKFQYLSPGGSVLAAGYVTLNDPDNCSSPAQISWTNGGYSATMTRDSDGNIVVYFD